MKTLHLVLFAAGSLGLAGCANQEPVAPAPPVGVGAVVGTVAADRDGDGIVDGYYTANGIYQPFQAPPCPPPPPVYSPPPAPTGERG